VAALWEFMSYYQWIDREMSDIIASA
jgi:hypothetical protein